MNYQLELEKIIKENEGTTPTLLLHSCCGPCSSYVLEYLSKYFKITILYYNPNIDTLFEYNKRYNEQIRIIKELPVINKISIIEVPYNNLEYLNYIKGLEQELEGGSRCSKCYLLRLEKTAQLALKNKFEYFTTTLTVSPYKNANKINEIGQMLEKKYHISYLYSDFKKKEGYKRSIILSKEYNLYRQDYCGCIFSKKD
ncbi:MAG: epoxyqueuosine reductase QueH [Bacilli bacterium]